MRRGGRLEAGTMAPVELQELVRAALAADGEEYLNRSGQSVYDIASDALKLSVSEPGNSSIIPSMIHLAEANLNKNTEWWLNFLGLYEQIEFFPRAASQLMEFFLASPPAKIESRAYVLRFLAYIGSPIQWDTLPAGLRVDDLASKSPLIVADALVWGLRFQDARQVISRALNEHRVSPPDVRQMVERWRRTVRPANTADIEEINTLTASRVVPLRTPNWERFGTVVAAFGKGLRESSRFYEPAKRYGFG